LEETVMGAIGSTSLWIGGLLIGLGVGMSVGKGVMMDVAVQQGVAHHDAITGAIVWDKVVCNESGN
jgi:hypothetical protein